MTKKWFHGTHPQECACSFYASRLRWAVEVGLRVVVPLLLGSAIYLLVRPTDIVAFDIVHAFGLGPTLADARSAMSQPPSLPQWLVWSGPTALWTFAFASALGLIWRGFDGPQETAWLAVCAAVAMGSELGQLAGWVQGDFDGADLFTCCVAFLVSVWLDRWLRTHRLFGAVS